MSLWKSALACACVAVLALTSPSPAAADAVLQQIDAHRVPYPNAEVMVRARTADGQTKDFQVFLNDRNESVVKMLTGVENGRYVLMTDTSFYLYIPSTSRPVRISPLQRLVGDANFGDIGRLTFAGSYRIEERAPSAAPAGPPTNVGFRTASGSFERIRLKATTRTATYDRIDLWVVAGSLVPVRADYYLVSGKHQKSAWFSSPESFGGGTSIRHMALANPTPPYNTTVVTTREAQSARFSRRDFSVNGFFQIN
ncbi:outer membrane lipoprotein-sorting protein [Salinarimonas sp.]|uniref:outer membrane lipoprotein-sorting protein n=1 Tax=Salinarimonas sp. TaxID=2766526 RepID=UPI0032D92D90